jgi:hypothetical protein
MAVDPEGSFNAELAKRYREVFSRDGIDLKLAPSVGAAESVARLQDPKSTIKLGHFTHNRPCIVDLFAGYSPSTVRSPSYPSG